MTALLTWSTGCDSGERGLLAAVRTGNLIAVMPARVLWPNEMQPQCERPEETGALVRAPYVQRVGDHGASVLWRSDAAALEHVTFWDPGDVSEGREVYAVESTGKWVPRHARLDDLRPGTVHCYVLQRDEAGEEKVVAGPYPFRTAPEGSDEDEEVHVVVFGDSGTGLEEQRLLAEQMRTVRSDLILHTGDIAYEGGDDDELEAHVFDVYAPLLRSVPMFPSLGNHDLVANRGEGFARAFELPRASDPEGVDRWYSFDFGPAHFVALDSTADFEEQVAWLDRDLEATDLPWVVVYFHHPLYSSGVHGSSHDRREEIAPVLARHHVPLVFNGHDHDYERTIPIDGTTYVVTGGGGRPITRADGDSAFTAFVESAHHFVYLVIQGRVARLYAIDATGRVFDSAELETER
ncbi:MAG: metallophosphoesterase [Sandaracinaceae bacterium]